jgi:hypothetical protein
MRTLLVLARAIILVIAVPVAQYSIFAFASLPHKVIEYFAFMVWIVASAILIPDTVTDNRVKGWATGAAELAAYGIIPLSGIGFFIYLTWSQPR